MKNPALGLLLSLVGVSSAFAADEMAYDRIM